MSSIEAWSPAPLCGQSIAACQLMVVPSRRQRAGRSRRHQGACLGDDGDGGELRPIQGGAEGTTERVLAYDMVCLMTSSHDSLWRAMLIGWLHGEVDALDFRPAKESDCWGSHVKRVLTDTGGVFGVRNVVAGGGS